MRVRGAACWVAATLLSIATHTRAAPAFGAERASAEVREVAHWVLAAADHRRRPFAIVDKNDARIYVFDAGGTLLGASATLLGAARGDTSPRDIADRAPESLLPSERTTPAGRFGSEPGHNDKGEAIVWIDYNAALALHRLRPAPAHQRRAQRLASASPEDNRISLGCIVVPGGFYDAVIAPYLGRRRGVVYVLPESGSALALLAPHRWD